MKLAFQLAFRNLIGAGLRTWLNVVVLSFAFVLIIFFNGLMDGWNLQAKKDTIEWEYGHGHLLSNTYDPLDPFTIQDGHKEIPKDANLTPVLVRQASIYPDGRMIPVALKGIDLNQNIVKIPTGSIKTSKDNFPAVIGKRMANSSKLQIGDQVLMRWRDKHGTFDATTITIVDIFDNNVSTVDNGQIWISIEKLWEITGLDNHATFLIASEGFSQQAPIGWNFKTQKDLSSTLDEIISTKKYSSAIMYLLLLAIALLAIFDTQVLSIFRRQKEIGTYISLGMTRWQVVGLFTVEGAVYSIMAMIVGSLYGVPLFIYMATNGISMPAATADMGISMAERIFPVYGIQLILITSLLVVISATIVSFLPAKKISKMDPVAALKGKLQ